MIILPQKILKMRLVKDVLASLISILSVTESLIISDY